MNWRKKSYELWVDGRIVSRHRTQQAAEDAFNGVTCERSRAVVHRVGPYGHMEIQGYRYAYLGDVKADMVKMGAPIPQVLSDRLRRVL